MGGSSGPSVQVVAHAEGVTLSAGRPGSVTCVPGSVAAIRTCWGDWLASAAGNVTRYSVPNVSAGRTDSSMWSQAWVVAVGTLAQEWPAMT